jgi:hypothetical protein
MSKFQPTVFIQGKILFLDNLANDESYEFQIIRERTEIG